MKFVFNRSAAGRRAAAGTVLALAAGTLSLGLVGPANAATIDLQGTLTGGGAPLANAEVVAYDSTGNEVETDVTDVNGHYEFSTLTDNVRVGFFPDEGTFDLTSATPYVWRYSGGTRGFANAATVPVTEDPATTPTYNMALTERYGSIAGTVAADGHVDSDADFNLDVNAINSDDESTVVDGVLVGSAYRLLVLPGTYRVSADGTLNNPSGPDFYYLRQWWRNADTLAEATKVPVGSGQNVAGINIALTQTLQARKAPQILGIPAIGRPLTAVPGTWSRNESDEFTYTWMRGATIVGTGPNYVPTAADFGSRLTLVVKAAWFAWNIGSTSTGQASSAQTDVVRYPADAKGKAKALAGHKARFAIKIVSAKQSPVKGKVVVMRGTKVVHKAVKLHKGRAVIVVKHQPKGKQAYTVLYKGNSLLSKAVKTFTVRVH